MGLLWPGIIRTFPTLLTAVLLFRPISIQAHEYRPDLAQWNLNENQEAGTNVLEYSTSRPSANYTPSPANWRQLPFYSLLLDKYADGDPSNNDFFNSTWENDANEVNLRYGGDIRGLERHLDYIQGMGMRGIYIAGTPFIREPSMTGGHLSMSSTLAACISWPISLLELWAISLASVGRYPYMLSSQVRN
jgi:hypothetical protein